MELAYFQNECSTAWTSWNIYIYVCIILVEGSIVQFELQCWTFSIVWSIFNILKLWGIGGTPKFVWLVVIMLTDIFCVGYFKMVSVSWRNSSGSGQENQEYNRGIRCADHATPSIRKTWYYFAKKRRSLGRYSSLADQSRGVFFYQYLDYIVSNGGMIGEWWIGKDLEGSVVVLLYAWRDFQKPQNTPVRIAGVMAEVWNKSRSLLLHQPTQ
jgi:hypothetical protein